MARSLPVGVPKAGEPRARPARSSPWRPRQRLCSQRATIDVPGARYATVEVDFPVDAARRVFVLTDRNGWKVDLVATFPGAFVANIPLAVERASSPGVDPELLASVRRQEVSLDALEAIGVNDRTAEAITEARDAMGIPTNG